MATSNGKGNGLRVALCAQESSFRDAVFTALVSGGHSVLARSEIGEGLPAFCNGSAPACIVVATERPDRPTLDMVRTLRSRLGDVAAVLVCRRAVMADVRRALELGIEGIVLENDVEGALAAVVAAVSAGQVSAPSGQRRAVRARALTTREKQILALMATGLTNAQIAAQLFLAESTVKSHLSSAFGKLDVSSRSEAAAVILDPERSRGLGIVKA
ncbi:MAG TPA: response regulator transcription factor [Solirubrobacterales bacterium]|nr:response regulator transcription factor [Solirubrobacterales bacterium]